MEVTKPKLSFIIANHGPFEKMRTCLFSLLDQTESNISIIVADNTPEQSISSDNQNLCWNLDPRVRYFWAAPETYIQIAHIRHKQCLYSALEMGVLRTVSSWLCFAGADAYFAPVFAERMLDLADEQPDLGLIHCDVVLGGPHHGYFTLVTRPANCGIDLQSMIIRRDVFQGFPEKHVNYELADGLMVEGLVDRGVKCGHVNQVLCVKN